MAGRSHDCLPAINIPAYVVSWFQPNLKRKLPEEHIPLDFQEQKSLLYACQAVFRVRRLLWKASSSFLGL